MIISHLPLERVFESSWFPKFPTQREKNPTSRVQILINPASRVAFKFRFPSRYFASSRIPHRSLVKSRIPKIPIETLPAPLIITFELVSQSCDCCVIVTLWSGKFGPPPPRLKNYVFLYPVYSLLSAVFLHWRMSFLSVPNAKHRLISRN